MILNVFKDQYSIFRRVSIKIGMFETGFKLNVFCNPVVKMKPGFLYSFIQVHILFFECVFLISFFVFVSNVKTEFLRKTKINLV